MIASHDLHIAFLKVKIQPSLFYLNIKLDGFNSVRYLGDILHFLPSHPVDILNFVFMFKYRMTMPAKGGFVLVLAYTSSCSIFPLFNYIPYPLLWEIVLNTCSHSS